MRVKLHQLEPVAGALVRGAVFVGVAVVVGGAWLKGAWAHAKDALL